MRLHFKHQTLNRFTKILSQFQFHKLFKLSLTTNKQTKPYILVRIIVVGVDETEGGLLEFLPLGRQHGLRLIKLEPLPVETTTRLDLNALLDNVNNDTRLLFTVKSTYMELIWSMKICSL